MTDHTHTPPPPGAPRARRWIRVVLVLSLAANLAVLGLALGAWLGHERHGERMQERREERALRDLGFGPYARAIPRAAREGLRADIAARRDSIEANRRQLRAAFEETLTTLRAEPFDREALAQQMQAQRAAIDASREIGQSLLLDRLEAMSAAERAGFADRLERGLGREPRRRRDN